MIGTIRIWYPEKGYGFILGPNSRMVFFHIQDWDNYTEIPQVGAVVEFNITHDVRHNKHKAVNLRLHAGASALKADAEAGL